MLVLTRRINESIVINGDIVVTVLEVGRNGQVRLGIEAPRHYQIYRRELWLEIEQENRIALASTLTDATTPAPSHDSVSKNGIPTDEPTPTGGSRRSWKLPLPRANPLYCDDRRALQFDVIVRRLGVGESLKLGGRNLVPGHEALGKILRRFELRGFLGWAKNF